MPPAKKPKWDVRRARSSDTMEAWAQQSPPAEVPEPERPLPNISAFERKQLYARLLWLEDYQPIRAAEAALHAPLLHQLTRAYTSVHTRRLIHSGTAAGERAADAVEARLTDCVGYLERSRSRLHEVRSARLEVLVAHHIPTSRRAQLHAPARSRVPAARAGHDASDQQRATRADHAPIARIRLAQPEAGGDACA